MRARYQPSSSLLLGRLQRAFRRQLPLMTVVALTIAIGGIAYEAAGGVRPIPAALVWTPIGLASALMAAALREFGRNTVTSLSSFGRHRGYAVMGAAPELTPHVMKQLPPDRRTPLDSVVFQPASAFATAFRDLQNSVAGDGIVSFIGAIPGEGASTAALCTAASAALQGRRVILVDCDVRGRSLTRVLVHDAPEGVLEASQKPSAWRTMLAEEEETGFHFLPAARTTNAWRSLSGLPGFFHMLGELRDAYDLVVLDCPPALSNADAGIVASGARRAILVTAWDRTPIQAVRAAMRTLKASERVSTAVYVNRVPQGYRFGRLRPD